MEKILTPTTGVRACLFSCIFIGYMKILAVSDVVVDWIYSPSLRELLSGTDLVIGCGDLPGYYLEYIISSLDIPLFHVRGNHSITQDLLDLDAQALSAPVDLHCKVLRYNGKTIAGIEGSLRYKDGPYQYTQSEMWVNVLRLVPHLLINRIRYGNFLDILVTHAPPWGIHDQSDYAHHGVKAFRWLLTIFKPSYQLHGHIHMYRPDTVTETVFVNTKVINVFGYKQIEI